MKELRVRRARVTEAKRQRRPSPPSRPHASECSIAIAIAIGFAIAPWALVIAFGIEH
jgi:hypothetical protein